MVATSTFAKHFPPGRVLTVVGTNYQTYGTRSATVLNRLFSTPHEFGWNYNRSDGLVKQIAAQLPGAPRTFVHKCHGGDDSLDHGARSVRGGHAVLSRRRRTSS